MARITITTPDDLLKGGHEVFREAMGGVGAQGNSHLIQCALRFWIAQAPGRADVSERGRLETLRATRAARQALDDLEATLTQAAPVQRRVRRILPPARP